MDPVKLHGPLKVKVEGRRGRKRDGTREGAAGESQVIQRTQSAIAGVEDGRRGPGVTACRCPLEAGTSTQLTVSKGQATEFCQHPKGARKPVLLETFQKAVKSCQQLDLSLIMLTGIHTRARQKCKIINVCCFKMPNLWYLVIAMY